MNKLSSRHFMFFIIATSTIALRSYSSIFINYGGRDTWLISLFASLIIFFYFTFLLYVFRKTNIYNITEIFSKVLPKRANNILIFIFSIGLFLSAIESASVNANSIHTNYFLSTPTWYCLLFIIIPAGYVLLKKFNSILVLVIIIGTITLIGDIILIALLLKFLDFNYLLPIMENGMTNDKWLCLLEIIGSFSSIVIALPYLIYLDKKESLLKHNSLAITISCILITISFISAIAFFSPDRAGKIFYPGYIESQRVQIAGFFEFGELFYIFRSVCLWFIKYILSSYGILLLYKDKIKKQKSFVIFYSLALFIASFIVTQNQYFLFYFLRLFQLTNLVFFIAIPLVIFIIFYFGKYNKKVTKKIIP
ncbi:endospore germination permease [Clostridium vincentii]|uniref:Spore germination protein n=1 Tax=Clostridium vincentii TaxID=52704 RepID=A0A2T0BGQ7_9CLOT|nr:endospore germination permease [Clostridium vincentii]PRR83038.1 Spore germination protein [Clostridium vincentii]